MSSEKVNVEIRATDPETGAQKGRKPQAFSLLPMKALSKVAEVYNFGATKYSRDNWRGGYPWSWSQDAKWRHSAAYWSGEDNDPESGLPHLAHEAFHVLTQLEYLLTSTGTDDRFHYEPDYSEVADYAEYFDD